MVRLQAILGAQQLVARASELQSLDKIRLLSAGFNFIRCAAIVSGYQVKSCRTDSPSDEHHRWSTKGLAKDCS